MKYVVNSTDLLSRLQNMECVILPKNVLPILGCVLFEAKGDCLTMTATDKEITLVSSVKLLETTGDSKFAINAKQISDILKSLPDQPLTIDINSATLQVNLNYQNGHMAFQAENGEDFPQQKNIEGESSEVKLNANLLNVGLGMALSAASTDKNRMAMCGVFVDVSPTDLSLVASDGHKFVRYMITCDTGNQTKGFILPPKPASILRSLIDKNNEDVCINTYTVGNATIDTGDYKMSCRLIEEKYPNYKSIIPQNNANIAVVDRQSFLSSVRRIMIAADKSSSLVKLQFETGKVVLSSENTNFSQAAEEQLVCQYEGYPLKIGFSGSYLIELIGKLNSEQISIKLSDPSKPGLILPVEQEKGSDTLMLLMPLLITN
ncbi:MAG: DNA polymerase III subunit beta [Prevotellaceae bacterium]|nr:DNA polymerase III subunit beta [Candidatus Faecinaster equi]